MAVRNSISSGHNILSTIHADKAASIPNRLYSLLESNLDLEQFLRSIHRYVQLGVHIKGYYSKELGRFHREVCEVTEFYVTENNEAKSNTIYKKTPDGKFTIKNPTKYLLGYLESQGVIMQPDILVKEEFHEVKDDFVIDKSTGEMRNNNTNLNMNTTNNINSGNINSVNANYRVDNSGNNMTINSNARSVQPQNSIPNNMGYNNPNVNNIYGFNNGYVMPNQVTPVNPVNINNQSNG